MQEEKAEVIIDDIIIPLRITNDDIDISGLDFSRITRGKGGKSRTQEQKNRKRMIDKEERLKKNIFNNKVMRRY